MEKKIFESQNTSEEPTFKDLVEKLYELGNCMTSMGKAINNLVDAGSKNYIDPEKGPKYVLDLIKDIDSASEPTKMVAEKVIRASLTSEQPSLEDLVQLLPDLANFMTTIGGEINKMVDAGLNEHIDPEKASAIVLGLIAQLKTATLPLRIVAESLAKK